MASTNPKADERRASRYEEESERWGALRVCVVVGKRKEKKKPKKLRENSYILEGSRTGHARTSKRSGREGRLTMSTKKEVAGKGKTIRAAGAAHESRTRRPHPEDGHTKKEGT